MTDPISNMLTCIRNAQAVKHPTVLIPFSKFKLDIAEVLEKEGLIGGFEKQGRKTQRFLELKLKYDQGGQPIIKSLKRISRPGQRIYIKTKEIRLIRQGYGFSIISTPKGLMTSREARKQGLGGEVICEIWI